MEEEKDRQQCCCSDPYADRVGSALFFRIWVGIKARHIKKCTLFPQKFSYVVKKKNYAVLQIREPVPFWSWIRNTELVFFRIPDLGFQTRIFQNSRTNFWVNGIIILWLNNMLYQFKNKIIYYFMIFVATNNSRTKNFPPSFGAVVGSEIRDPRSGIRDGQKWESWIRSATLKLWHRRHRWEK